MYKGHVQQAASGILQIFKYSAMMSTSTTRMDEVLNHTSLAIAKWGHNNCIPEGDLELHKITVSLAGKTILDRVNCTIDKGTFVGIVGPSGSGKSTLLKVLSKEVTPISGEIYVGGVDVAGLTEWAYRKLFRMAPHV